MSGSYRVSVYHLNTIRFRDHGRQLWQLWQLDRIRRRMQAGSSRPFPIVQKTGTKVVDIRDIQYVEVFNHNLVFHTRDGIFQMYGKLGTLEEDNRFSGFVKVSASHLVNGTCVDSIGKTTLEVAGDQIPLSRRRRKACLEKMAQILGGRLS